MIIPPEYVDGILKEMMRNVRFHGFFGSVDLHPVNPTFVCRVAGISVYADPSLPRDVVEFRSEKRRVYRFKLIGEGDQIDG